MTKLEKPKLDELRATRKEREALAIEHIKKGEKQPKVQKAVRAVYGVGIDSGWLNNEMRKHNGKEPLPRAPRKRKRRVDPDTMQARREYARELIISGELSTKQIIRSVKRKFGTPIGAGTLTAVRQQVEKVQDMRRAHVAAHSMKPKPTAPERAPGRLSTEGMHTLFGHPPPPPLGTLDDATLRRVVRAFVAEGLQPETAVVLIFPKGRK